MITLGLGKWFSRQQKGLSEHVPAALPTALKQTLSETIAWCSSPTGPGNLLRSLDLDPSKVINGPHLEERDIKVRVRAMCESYRIAAFSVIEKRAALIRERNISISDVSAGELKGNFSFMSLWKP